MFAQTESLHERHEIIGKRSVQYNFIVIRNCAKRCRFVFLFLLRRAILHISTYYAHKRIRDIIIFPRTALRNTICISPPDRFVAVRNKQYFSTNPCTCKKKKKNPLCQQVLRFENWIFTLPIRICKVFTIHVNLCRTRLPANWRWTFCATERWTVLRAREYYSIIVINDYYSFLLFPLTRRKL